MTLDATNRTDTSSDRSGAAAWLALLGWIGLVAIAGAIGAIGSIDAATFYAELVRPSWAPPAWLFGPAWTVLYLLMGTAAWLVWRTRPATEDQATSRRRGLALFVGHLVLNALWSWIFFRWHQGALAFAEVIVFWIAIAVTMTQFARVKRAAAWCLVPYLLWVTFASALTWAVWQANPGRL